ncbi:MAG: PAS domain-containing protein, partial [Hylemonella sp.]
MKAAPIGKDELDRLEALYRYRILDTAAEQEYDDYTRLAAHICGTPIALVSLVDAGRQWFKSRVGLDAAETPRDISFCGHAIHGREVFEVSDALEDERFADNPFVTQDPNIRFYAGAPLVTPDGHAVGTLCVIDSVPHKLSDAQKSALTTLGRRVVNQMEQRLRLAREQRLTKKVARQAQFQQVLLDSAMAAVISTAPDGLITSFNPAAERLLGYRSVDLINKEKVSLFHVREELQARAHELSVELGREVPTREAIVARALAGMPETREWSYRCRDGRLVPVMLSVSVLRDERDGVSGYIALAWDLTERNKAEQALRASESQLRLAMRAARMSLWDADLKAQRITLDARWNELAGYEPKEVGLSFERMLSLMLPHEADDVRVRMQAAVRGDEPEYFAQHRVRHRDGHWFWVESRGQVVQWDSDGLAARMIGISMDITQRVAADEALRSSAERLQLAMNAARTSLWDAYPETGRIVLDARWAELVGEQPRETEASFEELAASMPPEEVSGVLAKMLAVLKGEKTDYIAEHRVRHRQGYWIWIESRGRVVQRDAQGRAVRMIGTNTDITERRQAEQLKSEFVSTVSHELRTPLTSIGGALGLVCG